MTKEIVKSIKEKRNTDKKIILKIDIEKAKEIFKERKELFNRLKNA